MQGIQERGSTHVYKVNRISKEEIENMTGLCIYEQLAYCNAACPLSVDTKAMMKAAADGDFRKALQIYEKAVPFPLLLSANCEAPCEGKCKLREIGEGVAIRAVEQAVAAYGPVTKASSVFRMKKKKKTVIYGSGAFALFLAGELEKKAYPLTVYCEEPDRRAFLASAGGKLGGTEFEAELRRLEAKDIDFMFSSSLTPELYEKTAGDYDVVCASKRAAAQMVPEAQCDGRLMYSEAARLVIGCEGTILECAFGAKKAAMTADRLAQNLSPDNMRGREGPQETRLYTSLDAVFATSRTEAGADGRYTKEQASEEAARCIQCHCDECMKSCAFLKHYRKYPGLLSREIYNNTQIIMGDHQLNKPMNTCSLCGQCTVVCPNGFDMAYVCKSARQNMVSTDKMPLAPHEFALMDMMFSNQEAFLSRPQTGFDRCRYVFFPGCQAAAIAPETVKAAYEDLSTRLEGGVALMLGCCGAIADWAGRYEMYGKTRAFLDLELEKLGNPVVITACPTCRKELQDHPGVETVGILEILKEIGLPEREHREGTFAIHDACGARGDAGTQQLVREMASKLGCSIVDTPYSGDRSPCCGYGGLTAYANREVAKEMTEKCLERADEPYLSYCMACRDRFAREGRESRHILELVYGTDAGAPPDISEKRWNRLTLKRDALREFWGEEVENVELPYDLQFTEEALKMMDDRMILKSDAVAVLDYYRETGEAIEDAETGYLLARRRSGNVTFWLAFDETENGYLVRRAYSHRMNILKRQG